MNITTAKISDGGLSLLTHKLTPLNRKAERLGLTPITVNVVSSVDETWKDEVTKITHTRRFHHIEVTGEVPRINGWTVAARIEFTGTETGNFVVTAPGVENVSDEWRHVANRCDHCNHLRTRKDLIVIRHEDGTEKIVGRNCLADYIRTTNAEGLIEWCDWSANVPLLTVDAEDEFWGGDGWGRCEPGYKLETILQAASLCIRKLGWTSSKAAYDFALVSTRDDVARLLNPPRHSDALRNYNFWIEKHDLRLNEFDAEEAVKAREWLNAVDPGSSDYLHNLCVLRELDYVPASKVGIAVSIIVAAKKAREDELKRKENAKGTIAKEFIGTVKERLRDLVVTVKRTRSVEGDYGVKTIITFECGNCELTWFATGDRTEDFREGESYTVDATVKAHKDDARFGKSTVVNRVSKKVAKAA